MVATDVMELFEEATGDTRPASTMTSNDTGSNGNASDATTISRIWKLFKETCDPINCPAGNVSNRRKRCGCKPRPLEDLDALQVVPMKDRGDLQTFSAATGIPKSCLHRLVRRGSIKKHNGTTKPLLTPKNKLEQVNGS